MIPAELRVAILLMWLYLMKGIAAIGQADLRTQWDEQLGPYSSLAPESYSTGGSSRLFLCLIRPPR